MIRVTAYPTVEWLNARSFTNASMNATVNVAASSTVASSTTAPIISRLRRWSDTATVIDSSSWITTPDGEQCLDLVLSNAGRRVAYRFSLGYERNVPQEDALALVYGKLEALYRIQISNGRMLPADIAHLIVSMNPGWFSADGRVRAGRVASSSAMQVAQNLKQTGSVHFGGISIHRRRITRAREWVSDFERALGLPDFRTYVSGQISLKQSRPSLKMKRRPVVRGSVKG